MRHALLLLFLAMAAISGMGGCTSSPQEVAGGAVQTGANAMGTAGQTTVGVMTTVGKAGLGAVGTASEAGAEVMRGAGQAASEATGGQTGMGRDVQRLGEEIAKKRTVDVMGNEVEIDPTAEKKIRMEF